MLWNRINSLPGGRPLAISGYGPTWLFSIPNDDSHWLVGRYMDLTRLATALRSSEDLRELLSETKTKVRLGLRDSDKPPADVERQARYGNSVAGKDAGKDFNSTRVKSLATPLHPHPLAPPNRRSDREQNVGTFWNTQTPQSHHIVEFNNLETLGVSKKAGTAEMDYLQLPAVLLAAEFHQRYITAVLRPAQRWGKTKLTTDMVNVYRQLYQDRSDLFASLWEVSKIILREAGLTVT